MENSLRFGAGVGLWGVTGTGLSVLWTNPALRGCLLDFVVRAVAGYAASNVRIFVNRLRLTCAIAIESITATASPAFSLILVIPRTK